jgi:hypothetical protein
VDQGRVLDHDGARSGLQDDLDEQVARVSRSESMKPRLSRILRAWPMNVRRQPRRRRLPPTAQRPVGGDERRRCAPDAARLRRAPAVAFNRRFDRARAGVRTTVNTAVEELQASGHDTTDMLSMLLRAVDEETGEP